MSQSKVSRITIARLFNLGSYEHVRYEISADVAPDESPAVVMLGLERIINALSPKTHTHSRGELDRERVGIEAMHRLLSDEGPEEFRRRHGHFVGTPEEYIARCEQSYAENVKARDDWEARSAQARKHLDDLGGASEWRDSKLDWYDDDDGCM